MNQMIKRKAFHKMNRTITNLTTLGTLRNITKQYRHLTMTCEYEHITLLRNDE